MGVGTGSTAETQGGKSGASFAFVSLRPVIKLVTERKTTQKQYYLWNVKTVKKKIIYN